MALSGAQRRRLDERLEVLRGTLSEQQYLLHLQTPAGAAELSALVSVIAVHKTDLFRDEVQLTAFRAHVLEPLAAKSAGRPLRVWSAGCATGEEVATLLIMMEEAGADPGSTVLGTDISEVALNRARAMSFPGEQVRRLPPGLRERYFIPDGSRCLLVPELRERATFQHHNLMESPYPAAGGGEGFDVIFCRNVLIYFTSEAFNQVVESLASRLAPGGTLVLSAAEPLLHAPPSLRVIRSENAFFYVRTLEPFALRRPSLGMSPGGELAVPLEWPKEPGNLMNPSSAPGPESRRDSGRFPAVPLEGKRDSGRFPAVPLDGKRDSGRFPAVPLEGKRDSGRFPVVPLEGKRDSGRFPAVPLEGKRDSGRFPVAPSPSSHDPELELAYAEADSLFTQVLEGAGETDSQKEEYLRRCLALDPDLSAARYLLGMLLELREAFPEAAAEYRRALLSLEEGRARPTPFFLNHARLEVACARAIERMEGGGRPR
jgi:chemotaxis protein methyltransferase CheR